MSKFHEIFVCRINAYKKIIYAHKKFKYFESTVIEETWNFRMLHRCMKAKFLIKLWKIRQHALKHYKSSKQHGKFCDNSIFWKNLTSIVRWCGEQFVEPNKHWGIVRLITINQSQRQASISHVTTVCIFWVHLLYRIRDLQFLSFSVLHG